MIKTENLTKKFGTLTVLSDISVEINKGEVISIIGPSGCGKSTFLRCINRLEKATSGDVFIDGESIFSKKSDVAKIRQKMGMVFQSFNLYSHLMIIENVMLGPLKLLKIPRVQAYAEAEKYLEMVGLLGKAYAYPDELSGGQKQRVAIARALAMKPEILLFDEPTSALDPTMVSEVLAVIRKLASEGLTMMIVTHEMKFARDVSTRVFYMDEMGIYEDGTPEQIFDNPRNPKTRAFIQKIRSFEYQITGRDFDLYELNAKLEDFMKKQMLSEKQVKSAQLVTEEFLYNLMPDVPAAYTAEYSDLSEELTLNIEFCGEPKNPFENRDGDLSFILINKIAKSAAHSYKDEKNIVKILI